MKHRAAGEKIGASLPQFSGRTAAENKSPPVGIGVNHDLNRIEHSRNGLGFVDQNEVRAGLGRQLFAFPSENAFASIRIPLMRYGSLFVS